MSTWDEFLQLKYREGIRAKDIGCNGTSERVLPSSLLGHQFSLLFIHMRPRRYSYSRKSEWSPVWEERAQPMEVRFSVAIEESLGRNHREGAGSFWKLLKYGLGRGIIKSQKVLFSCKSCASSSVFS